MGAIESSDDSLPEFVLGHLSTPDGRAARARLAHEGFYHDLLLQPSDPQPGEDVLLSAFAGAHVSVVEVTLYYTTNSSVPQPGKEGTHAVPMRRTAVEWDTLTWSYGERWHAVIPGQPLGTHVRYSIEAVSPAGDKLHCPHVPLPPDKIADKEKVAQRLPTELRARLNAPRTYGYVVDQERVPEWLQEAVVYQIFVDRFAPDPGKVFADPASRSGFYGGTLRGVRDRLDYLADLGVTCIWLTPIFPTPSHHGYDATDYGVVEPRLGDVEDLERLVHSAHARGVRVVLDYVANHISSEHPAFLAAQADNRTETAAWFHFYAWPREYDTFYGVRSMPKLDTDADGVRAYLIDNANRWLERGVDGFRLDHAHGATHAFWSVFRAATRAVKPDCATFGEVTDTPIAMRSFAGRMDGELDFPLLEALRKFFAFHQLTPSEFDQFLVRHFAYFDEHLGGNLVLPSFLDNHDMNRFLYIVGGDARRLKLAAMCQFTLPGPPIIYYGTEVGLSQLRRADPLEEARLPMPWDDVQDQDLLDFYRALIALRRKAYPVWRQARNTLLTDDERGVYVYRCGPYVIALNNGTDAATVKLQAKIKSPLAPCLTTVAEAAFDQEKGCALLPPYAGIVMHEK